MHPVLASLLVASAVTVVAACGAATTENSAAAGAKRAVNDPAVKEAASKVNMDEVFPPGPGRDLALNNCQNCHTFVPIVILQMDKDAWTRSSIDHRERVTSLTDEEFKTVYEYLSATFNPDRPVPTLPKALLESWTSY